MKKTWTRRDVVRGAVAASAIAATPGVLSAETRVNENTAPDAFKSPGGDEAQLLSPPLRERLSMDSGWRFALGHASDPAKDFGFGAPAQTGTFAKSGESGGPTAGRSGHPFDDSAWKRINLPHDWAVDLPFVLDATLVWHGGKPLGRQFPETSVGWYRKTFSVPAADCGKRMTIEFDGVYRDAMVFMNGHLLTRNASGYAPFDVDVTDFLNYGEKGNGAENILVLRVDASLNEGWFYEGAGIYRHVWLTKTAPVHIARWGSFVQARFAQGIAGAATLMFSTEVVNETAEPVTCGVSAAVKDPAGAVIATVRSKSVTLAPAARATLEMEAIVPRPELWSLDSPKLHHLQATLVVDGKPIDQDETTFGIRSIRFDVDRGFFLNEQHVKIKGTCNHQDHAGLGVALPNRMQFYRIGLLKEMGSNAYRTSHNCPTSELLHACDHLGMLVLDETRTFSSSTDGLGELERLVRRDRNHPCVIMWSIANEENQQSTERGARIGSTMKALVKRLDPTRPITAAMNNGWGKGLSGVVDVQGFNYRTNEIDAYRKKFPSQPLIGTEVASTLSTRGIYADDAAHGFVAAYDIGKPKWGDTAEDWWKFYDEREWLAGGFVWTGFDYRGEPTPYHLPCVSSHFGLMDTCGFPKDNYFYYRTWWRTEPSLHLFPHWNWAVAYGTAIDVWCYSNQESVELLLNGKSLGSQPVAKNGHLEWKVPYAPGTLEARGSTAGKVVLTSKRETAGPAASIRLQAESAVMKADGEDVVVLRVEVVDAAGRIVPLADHLIQFKLDGPATLLCVGNGNPSSYEPDRASERHAFNGLCMCIVQSQRMPGKIVLKASSTGLKETQLTINCQSATPRAAI